MSTSLYNTNLEELYETYHKDRKFNLKNKIKFGTITFFNPMTSFYEQNQQMGLIEKYENSENSIKEKKYMVKQIEPKPDQVALFKDYLETLLFYQQSNNFENYTLKIKKVYKDPNSDVFYVVQRDYNRGLTRKIGRLNEMELLAFLREVCRFYYKLKNHKDLMDCMLDEKLGVMPLKIENINYFRKSSKNKKKLAKNALKIDFLNFNYEGQNDQEENEISSQTIYNIHIRQLKTLIIKLLIEVEQNQSTQFEFTLENIKQNLENVSKSKRFGIITKNLLNVLIDPKNSKLKWDDIFQNPLLRINIEIPINKKTAAIWKINQARDKKISVEYLTESKCESYEENKHQYQESKDESFDNEDITAKAVPLNKNKNLEKDDEKKENDDLEEDPIEVVDNPKIYDYKDENELSNNLSKPKKIETSEVFAPGNSTFKEYYY